MGNRICLSCKDPIPIVGKKGKGDYCGKLCWYLDNHCYADETRDQALKRMVDHKTIKTIYDELYKKR